MPAVDGSFIEGFLLCKAALELLGCGTLSRRDSTGAHESGVAGVRRQNRRAFWIGQYWQRQASVFSKNVR